MSEEGVRLQKALAAAGVASRRASEELIVAGRVRVNGAVVTELGTRVDPLRDRIEVDGTAVQSDVSMRYFMLNKPVGIVSSLHDERGRPDLSIYTREVPERLFSVGRLDQDTSGLLILTNDGETAHMLSHPSFGVQKSYVARVAGSVGQRTIARLIAGVELEDGPIAADSARLLDSGAPAGAGAAGGRVSSLVELTLHSGRNRIVRRMLDAVGHPVIELVRRRFGPLTLGTLPSGRMRELTKVEVGRLLTLSRSAPRAGDQPGTGRASEGGPARKEPPRDRSTTGR